jgi:hypothetical protein
MEAPLLADTNEVPAECDGVPLLQTEVISKHSRNTD